MVVAGKRRWAVEQKLAVMQVWKSCHGMSFAT